eukprot:1159874-Pelagomonas_calceolata.AAC.9
MLGHAVHGQALHTHTPAGTMGCVVPTCRHLPSGTIVALSFNHSAILPSTSRGPGGGSTTAKSTSNLHQLLSTSREFLKRGQCLLCAHTWASTLPQLQAGWLCSPPTNAPSN